MTAKELAGGWVDDNGNTNSTRRAHNPMIFSLSSLSNRSSACLAAMMVCFLAMLFCRNAMTMASMRARKAISAVAMSAQVGGYRSDSFH